MVGIAKDYLNQRYEAIISSPDKDVLQQIPGKHYNYQKAEFVETTEKMLRSFFGSKFLWAIALMAYQAYLD